MEILGGVKTMVSENGDFSSSITLLLYFWGLLKSSKLFTLAKKKKYVFNPLDDMSSIGESVGPTTYETEVDKGGNVSEGEVSLILDFRGVSTFSDK